MIRRIISFVALSLLMLGTVSAEEGSEVFLEPHFQNGVLTVTPWVNVTTAGQYRYALKSSVESRSGSSNASSSGQLDLPNRLVRLNASTTHRLSGPDDRIQIRYRLFKGAQLLAEDVLVFP